MVQSLHLSQRLVQRCVSARNTDRHLVSRQVPKLFEQKGLGLDGAWLSVDSQGASGSVELLWFPLFPDFVSLGGTQWHVVEMGVRRAVCVRATFAWHQLPVCRFVIADSILLGPRHSLLRRCFKPSDSTAQASP